ncbi:hypothetical protein BpHYR1_053514 [Brachionus plicatilis]|uniref:Uncharacterized protein n=1 Tax=Brachionus plicatilis TaxID=10195 RepID=A0A3M7RNM2_BRAPC|nr:hypothetical protein BpHYR1_053514 [Brachionus plicatilis]
MSINSIKFLLANNINIFNELYETTHPFANNWIHLRFSLELIDSIFQSDNKGLIDSVKFYFFSIQLAMFTNEDYFYLYNYIKRDSCFSINLILVINFDMNDKQKPKFLQLWNKLFFSYTLSAFGHIDRAPRPKARLNNNNK